MQGAPSHNRGIAPSASVACAVSTLVVHELDRDTRAVAMPRAETQLVVRCGPSVRGGLEVHAVAGRQQVHRKLIGAGHWSVTARLRLDAQQAVLGVPASQIAGGIVAIGDLWGDAAARRILDRLAHAGSASAAARVLESAIAEQLALGHAPGAHAQLALHAAERLASGNVHGVALELGMSDRHLRRIFREAVGLSPKAFAKLARFQRAVAIARADTRMSWARIAAATGYYDQAHLSADFRAIAGATPRTFLGELRQTTSLTTR